MLRYLQTTLLGLTLLCGHTACTSKLVGPTTPSGYFFSLQTYDQDLWLVGLETPVVERLARVAELTVRVQDAQGRPVDGVAVAFSVEPAWVQSVSLTPERTRTQSGTARAILEPATIGVLHVQAQVENLTQDILIRVSNASTSNPSGGN
jgi:hypothetical protein